MLVLYLAILDIIKLFLVYETTKEKTSFPQNYVDYSCFCNESVKFRLVQ